MPGELALIASGGSGIGQGMVRTMADPDAMANCARRIALEHRDEPAAVFLASDMARYVTGLTLPVDGGFLAY